MAENKRRKSPERKLTKEQKLLLEKLRRKAEGRRKGKKGKKNRLIWFATAVLTVLLFIGFILNTPAGNTSEELIVRYFDVGQGDSIYVSCGGDNMLIDCGEASKSDELGYYLSELDVTSFTYVIGTHPHSDHMGGMADIVENYDIGEFIIPHLPEKDIPTTKYFNNFMDAAEKKRLDITEAHVGRSFSLGEAKCEIIAPCSESCGNTNNYSVGVIIRHGEKSFIFTGDAETSAEKEMLELGNIGHMDVYKVGHHGSDTSSSEEFLEELTPDIAVISCGAGNSYGHPADVTLKKLSKYTDSVYRTDLCGTVVITSDGENLSVETERSGR